MPRTLSLPFFFFSSYGDHRDLHSFPTRRSSDLRSLFLVSGTNGKTTTTALLAAALGTAGPIVHNTTGANLKTGLVSALAKDLESPVAVLEVDEAALVPVLAETTATAVVLLNLSRDQLDRYGE